MDCSSVTTGGTGGHVPPVLAKCPPYGNCVMEKEYSKLLPVPPPPPTNHLGAPNSRCLWLCHQLIGFHDVNLRPTNDFPPYFFTPENAEMSQCLIILMVLVVLLVAQNNQHYHSCTIMGSELRTLGQTHGRQTFTHTRRHGSACTVLGSSFHRDLCV